MKTVITYGTFDLFHIGHLNLLRRAKDLGDYLIVAVSTDRFNWVEKHKKCQIPDKDRMAIVEAIKYVDKVIPEDSWDQKIKDGIKDLVSYKSSGKEMDMSEVPTYLVDFYLPLANHYSDIVGQFRPEVNNSGITERLNRFFYETVTNQ